MCEYILEIYLQKQKTLVQVVWLFDFVSYFLARYKNENNPKNKFEKLVHLVGFIIRIYHDARSPERQIHHLPC